MTVDEFIVRHGEFAEQVASGKVQTALTDATLRTDARVFGDSTDEAIGWLACHLLISDPAGRSVRQQLGKDGQSTYLDMRRRLEAENCHMWIGSDGC